MTMVGAALALLKKAYLLHSEALESLEDARQKLLPKYRYTNIQNSGNLLLIQLSLKAIGHNSAARTTVTRHHTVCSPIPIHALPRVQWLLVWLSPTLVEFLF